MPVLAQVSPRDELIFHLLLLPAGLWLLAVGVRAVRRREFHLRKRGTEVTGVWAMLLGVVAGVIGIVCIVASASTLWHWAH